MEPLDPPIEFTTDEETAIEAAMSDLSATGDAYNGTSLDDMLAVYGEDEARRRRFMLWLKHLAASIVAATE